MAVVPNALAASIQAAGAAFSGSQQLPQIATAVGLSVPAWLPLPSNVFALGVTAGLAGVGVTTGKMTFVPGGFVVASLAAAGITGPTGQGVGQAVELGTAALLNAAAQYLGTSFGVSAGADVTKVALANPAPLIALLISNLAAAGIAGSLQPSYATGLGNGIAALVGTGFGVGGVAPVAPAPGPAAGTSFSIVF